MRADAALRSLLCANRDAIVAAVGRDARLVPLPPSVPLEGHQTFEGQIAMDLMVPGDQFAIIDGWARAQDEPIVQFNVHLLAEPDTPATVHIFDVRAEYGVHVAVFEGQNLEAVLRSSEARAAMPRGPAHMKRDAVANFLEVDAQTSAMLGWSATDLIGRSTVGLVHPDDAEQAIDSWMEMRTRGRSRLRVRLRHADGHYVWVEVTNENRLDDPSYGCVLTEMLDISAEMAQLAALHDRERQLAQLAEALPIGICHLRPDRGVIYTNAPLVHLLGPVETVDALLHRLAPGDRPVVEAALDSAFNGVAGHLEVSVIADDEERRCELTLRAMANDDGTIDGVIVCASDVTDRSRLREELEHRASHDALTGCLNRAATAAAVELLLLESRRVAVAFIDLDNFKAINDDIGHAAGDELLRVAAGRLRSVTRDGDMLGRLGGDEFVVVCTGGDALDPNELADRLTTALNGEVVFAGRRLILRASVGAAISFDGELGAEGLLQRADAAMYAAKRDTRATCASV